MKQKLLSELASVMNYANNAHSAIIPLLRDPNLPQLPCDSISCFIQNGQTILTLHVSNAEDLAIAKEAISTWRKDHNPIASCHPLPAYKWVNDSNFLVAIYFWNDYNAISN